MIWLTWRQFRTQAAVAVGALVVVAIVSAITGPHLVHLYDTSVATCQAHGDCSTATAAFLRNDHDLFASFGTVVGVAPFLLGIFWGAPLVARELETGTNRLAWTQSVTRTRWLALKLGVVGLASMAVAGLLSLMLTWWASPFDTVNMSPFNSFDQRGIVPIGYAAFAFAVGVTAGLLIRRTLPAMAATLVAFVVVRVVMSDWVRQRLMAPLHLTVGDNEIAASGNASPRPAGLNPRAWILSNQTINGAGRVIGQDGGIGPNGGNGTNIGVGPNGVTIQGLGSCPNIRFPKIHQRPRNPAVANALVQKCIDQLRIRDLLTYQPASRYWAFQWYEMAIFLGASLILAGFCFWWVRRRLS
jgi:hypothetical protein